MSSYIFNTKTRRYEDSRGRAVPPERVREWVREATEKSKARLKGFAEDYKSGKINHPEFFVRLNEEITRAHSALAMIATGGKSAMTPKTWGRVGRAVSVQRRFSRQFSAETLRTDKGDFPVWRAESYASVYSHTYENMTLMRDAGRKVERVLGTSEEHCGTCPAKAGIYDAENAPTLGSDECGPGCNCYFREYEEKKPARKRIDISYQKGAPKVAITVTEL